MQSCSSGRSCRECTDAALSASAVSAFGASVLVRQALEAEGDGGKIFARVTWSDGASEDVPYAYAAAIDELNVTSLSPNLAVAPPTGTTVHGHHHSTNAH